MSEDKEYWVKRCAVAESDLSFLQAENAQLKSQLEQARECLKFYANKAIYLGYAISGTSNTPDGMQNPFIYSDRGQYARDFLEEKDDG